MIRLASVATVIAFAFTLGYLQWEIRALTIVVAEINALQKPDETGLADDNLPNSSRQKIPVNYFVERQTEETSISPSRTNRQTGRYQGGSASEIESIYIAADNIYREPNYEPKSLGHFASPNDLAVYSVTQSDPRNIGHFMNPDMP